MSEILCTSCVLIPVILLLRALLGKKISMRLRYALWLLVALRLLLPVQFGHSALSVQNVMQSVPTNVQSAVIVTYDDGASDLQAYEVKNTYEQVNYQRLICNIWYVGIGIMALWIITVNLSFYIKARKGATRLSLPNIPLRVYVTEGVSSPCLMGTSIFLTPEIASDESKRAHVLAHEMTHFYHADSLWSIVRSVCLCVYWFHPLVWFSAVLSKRDCELACDEGTIQRLGESERYYYGKTLICVAAQSSKAPLLHTATTMSLSKKQLKERIKAIAAKQKRSVAVVLVLCLILSLTVVCTFTGRALEKVQPLRHDRPFAEQVLEEMLELKPEDPENAPLWEETHGADAPTEEKTQEDTQEPSEEMQEDTEKASVSENTQAQQITYLALERGAYLGEFTLQIGQSMELLVQTGQHTKLRNGDSAKISAELTAMSIQNYFAPQNYCLTVCAKKAGTVEVYFSDLMGEYLAATIHVVSGENADGMQEEEFRGMVIPSFLIP